jgi:acyl-coenzyme A thioesterase PaaI-like protein
MPSDMPEGFFILDPDDPFEMKTGPFYACDMGENRTYAFRMNADHANAGGAIHGGALMTFADFAICAEAVRGFPEEAPLTISFSSEFLAPVYDGALIESRPEILRRTNSFVFMRATLEVDGQPVLSCTGVIKRLKRSR